MNEIDFDALPEAEKYRLAFYFIHQLFSYCLSLDNPSGNEALKDADVLENPAEYLCRTKALCLKIGLNKADRIKELTLDTSDLLDDISWDLENKFKIVCKNSDSELPNIYETFPCSIFSLKVN